MACEEPDCSFIRFLGQVAVQGSGVDVVMPHQSYLREQLTAAAALPPLMPVDASPAARRCLEEIKAADRAVRRAGASATIDGPEMRAAERALARARTAHLSAAEIRILEHRVESIRRKVRAGSADILPERLAYIVDPNVGQRQSVADSTPVDRAIRGSFTLEINFAVAKKAGEFAQRDISRATAVQDVERLLADAKAKLKNALASTIDRREVQSLRARLANLEASATSRLEQLGISESPSEDPSIQRLHGSETVHFVAGGRQDAGKGAITGTVVFAMSAGSKFTIAQMEQMSRHINSSNGALARGVLSETGKVSTTGALRKAGSIEAARERRRAELAGRPYSGQVGHVPDATWTGRPGSDEWHDQDPKVNASLGGQSRRYAVGFVPTDFALGYNWKKK